MSWTQPKQLLALNPCSWFILSLPTLPGISHSVPLFFEHTKLIPTSGSPHLLVLCPKLSGPFPRPLQKRYWLFIRVSAPTPALQRDLLENDYPGSEITSHSLKLSLIFFPQGNDLIFLLFIIDSCLKRANPVTTKILPALFRATSTGLDTMRRAVSKSGNTS